jgi:hypothetical protein
MSPSGKTFFFVANQANIDSISSEKLASLEAEHKQIVEENKLLVGEFKAVTSGRDTYLPPREFHSA